jgi:hypothetical protein
MSQRITTSGWLGTLVLVACAACGCGTDTGASAPQGDASGTSGLDLTSSDTGSDTGSDTTAATDTPTGSTTEPAPPATPAVACDECFPFEQLPLPLQARAEELLLTALDREALYTLAADIKPMSSGFVSLEYKASDAPPELDDLRQIFAVWTCTPELSAGLQVFHQTFEGLTYADGVVFNTPQVAATVERFDEVFSAIGVAADDPAMAIVDAVDADPSTRRFRGYGHLFGYPAHAVDFFVEAEEQEAMTGQFVERDFIHIPTFESDEGRFVYAVPKGHTENAEDAALRALAAPVLARYAELRAESIGDGKPGALHLVRSWFDDGDGRCSPRHAKVLR